jgi:hypothetical protein
MTIRTAEADFAFKYIIIDEDAIRPFYEDGLSGDWNMFCRAEYTLMGLVCVKISSALLETIRPSLGRSFDEVSATEAIQGIQFFSEIRDEISIFESSPEVHYTWAMDDESTFPLRSSDSPPPSGNKVKRSMTAEEISNTVSFMYKFAKEIIENEYSNRLKYIRKVSELEAATWEIQKHEAREWLTYGDSDPSHVTPFLDYIATERSFDKTTLANKILEKAEEYQDRLSTMLVTSQKILKKFEACTTVKELNVLYEDYFGIMMPTEQAIELGRAHDGYEADGTFNQNKSGLRMGWFKGVGVPSAEGEEGAEWAPDVINPFLGNKLNF